MLEFGANLNPTKTTARVTQGYLDDVAQVFKGDAGSIKKITDTFDETGTMYSMESLKQMRQNARSGDLFQGMNVTGGTRSGNLMTGSLDNLGVGSMIGGALIGGVTNAFFGGSFLEGAAVGAVGGMGAGIAAKSYKKTMAGLEESVMKRNLGAKYKSPGDSWRRYKPETFRNTNLKNLKNIDLDEVNSSFDKFMINQINKEKTGPIGMETRNAVLLGGALTGSMFTGRKETKGRGLNRTRGNRF